MGVGFRLNTDESKYECICIRPTNGRTEDQERRNHSVATPTSFEQTRAMVRQVEEARWAIQVHRLNNPRGASVDFARQLYASTRFAARFESKAVNERKPQATVDVWATITLTFTGEK